MEAQILQWIPKFALRIPRRTQEIEKLRFALKFEGDVEKLGYPLKFEGETKDLRYLLIVKRDFRFTWLMGLKDILPFNPSMRIETLV
jgi:hypothetical protein